MDKNFTHARNLFGSLDSSSDASAVIAGRPSENLVRLLLSVYHGIGDSALT